jgi:hypothetical protein
MGQGLLRNLTIDLLTPSFDTDNALRESFVAAINIVESQTLIYIMVTFEHFFPVTRVFEMKQNVAHNIPHIALLLVKALEFWKGEVIPRQKDPKCSCRCARSYL